MYNIEGEEVVPHSEWVRIFKDIVEEVKEEYKNRSQENKFIGARVSSCNTPPPHGRLGLTACYRSFIAQFGR